MGIQRQIELQHIDMGLADQAEQPAFDMAADQGRDIGFATVPRALATRGTWNRAAAGVISGSSPLAEAVTRSSGTGMAGFSACSLAVSAAMRSFSFLAVGA